MEVKYLFSDKILWKYKFMAGKNREPKERNRERERERESKKRGKTKSIMKPQGNNHIEHKNLMLNTR